MLIQPHYATMSSLARRNQLELKVIQNLQENLVKPHSEVLDHLLPFHLPLEKLLKFQQQLNRHTKHPNSTSSESQLNPPARQQKV